MRRWIVLLSALVSVSPASAQGLPPHAWLFGTWTGGMFPVPTRITPQECFSQPVVIFTRDLVLRAVLTQQQLIQREIQTARATPTGFEFRFPGQPAPVNPMFGDPAVSTGFGCATPNDLTIQRRGENEITFPGCADFPYPLVRCETR